MIILKRLTDPRIKVDVGFVQGGEAEGINDAVFATSGSTSQPKKMRAIFKIGNMLMLPTLSCSRMPGKASRKASPSSK